MKAAYAFAALAFACVSAPAAAQTTTYHTGTPVERFPGDPVQGGAMKEYQAPPRQPVIPSGRVDDPRGYGYGGSYPRADDRSSQRGPGIDSSMLPPPAPRSELVVQSRNGVSWLCGGVGDQEQAHMKSQASRYDMMLTFAAGNGAYLAGVAVDIVGDGGRVILQTQCDGPIMLVDIPQGGRYQVRARADDYEVTRTVQIRENQQQYRQVVMTWPASAVGIRRNYSSGDIGDTTESSGRRR